MKSILLLVSLFGGLLSAGAQEQFTRLLVAVEPRTQNSWFSARADFSLADSTVTFRIKFGLEHVVPTSAHIVGVNTDFSFDLGAPGITIHSPYPWPQGYYDGATRFSGSFVLPNEIKDDFVARLTRLQLLGSPFGDFQGRIIPVPEPSTTAAIVCGLALLRLWGTRGSRRAIPGKIMR